MQLYPQLQQKNLSWHFHIYFHDIPLYITFPCFRVFLTTEQRLSLVPLFLTMPFESFRKFRSTRTETFSKKLCSDESAKLTWKNCEGVLSPATLQKRISSHKVSSQFCKIFRSLSDDCFCECYKTYKYDGSQNNDQVNPLFVTPL